MQAQNLFYLFIGFIVIEFLIEKFLEYLNVQHFREELPYELSDVYAPDAYQKSQNYKLLNYRFNLMTSIISFTLLLFFMLIDGFARLDQQVARITDSTFWQSVLYFDILIVAVTVINLPFSYYKTFVIEEQFGFNKSTKILFFTDKIKSLLMNLFFASLLLGVFIWFYREFGRDFWIYAWIFFAVFMMFINIFYTSFIVPLFNKLTPLEDGELKEKLKALAQKTSYNIDKIFVMDGSKRSTKANAFFSGFGPKKKVVLYDTLLQDLTPDEITAVLAHEIGHFKRKHLLFNLILSIMTAGIMLYLLSLVIDNQLLAEALGVSQPKFHINMIAFALLFTPVSFLTGLLTNWLSRKFEYQADAFAKQHYNAASLISGLKKLSRKSLSNLTPHTWYVAAYFSHPTLLQRIKALNLSEKQ